jgi:Mg2+ and Co2+ transporter CorA
MNVHVPGQDDQSSHNWFFGIIGLMVVISAATSWFIWIMKVQGSKTE